MTKPKQPALRAKISNYVEAAYLHGLPTENLDTGKSEPPRDISDVAWITDSLIKAFEATCMEVIGPMDDVQLPAGDVQPNAYRNQLRRQQRQALQKLLERGEDV